MVAPAPRRIDAASHVADGLSSMSCGEAEAVGVANTDPARSNASAAHPAPSARCTAPRSHTEERTGALSERFPTSLPSRIASRRGARAARSWSCVATITVASWLLASPASRSITSAPVADVEVPGGLVGEDHARPDDERPGDRDALLLAAGEMGGEMRGAIGEADLLEQCQRSFTQLRRAYPYRCESRLDVFERGQGRDQVELLEDEAERLEAELCQLAVTENGEVASLEDDVAGARTVERTEQLQQGRLAGSTRALERHELAGLDLQIDAADSLDRGGASLEEPLRRPERRRAPPLSLLDLPQRICGTEPRGPECAGGAREQPADDGEQEACDHHADGDRRRQRNLVADGAGGDLTEPEEAVAATRGRAGGQRRPEGADREPSRRGRG